jgi:hypothetical protein
MPVVVMNEADSGRRVAVSGMWVLTFEETDRGTVFKFLNGEQVRVEEGFDAVMRAWERGAGGSG